MVVCIHLHRSSCSASKAILEASIADLVAQTNAASALGVTATGADGLLQSVTVKLAEVAAAGRTVADADRVAAAELAGEKSRLAAVF